MGQVRKPKPVLLVTAISSSYDSAIDWALERLPARYGSVFLLGPRFEFDHTHFYSKTMGSQIRKQLIAFEGLINPGDLATIKNETNQLETDYENVHSHEVQRPLNLDPGYITEAKLVLGTVKNRDHRIYVGQGIYAEVTLSYYGRKWNGSRWTYPDYLTVDSVDFFERCRLELRRQMHAGNSYE